MKCMQEVGEFRQAMAPYAKTTGKDRHAPAVAIELRVLRLAADAADIRREFTAQQLAKYQPLSAALDACEALFEALGWGGAQVHGAQVHPERAQSSGH